MKYLNKIIRKLESILWLGFCCSILQAQVVITEFFIKPASPTDNIPQWIELYNNSDSTLDLTNWSIVVNDSVGNTLILDIPFLVDPVLSGYPPFLQLNNQFIAPNGYFLIASIFDESCSNPSGCTFYNNRSADVWAPFILPGQNYTKIMLKRSDGETETVVDQIIYDNSWPLLDGHSLRLHISPNSQENDDYLNWSPSPVTDISERLNYDTAFIHNFGSPRKENAFQLIAPENLYHVISGDINNYTPDNIDFSWVGTFNNVPSVVEYRLLINKIDSWMPNKHGSTAIPISIDDTLIWTGISNTNILVVPQDLLIDQLEIANFTWTVELTKGTSTIYSDNYSFTIDASDYGIYGCVDDGSCTDDPKCPTTADDVSLISNHPDGCTPDVDCYSALNYHQEANINSNICHYVSLSVPAIVKGDMGDNVLVPVYLYNESPAISEANIDSISYKLSFDYGSSIAPIINGHEIIAFYDTVLPTDFGNYTIEEQNDTISVNIAGEYSSDWLFDGAGIITYLQFYLLEKGVSVTLSFSDIHVKGGSPVNDIAVPFKDGNIIILQDNYEIWGNVVYYSGDDPYEVPNVELILDQKYDGENMPDIFTLTTNQFGYYNFESLIEMEGYYSLTFSKSQLYDNNCILNNYYVSGVDVSQIARHVSGSDTLNSDQLIAADVSLDGTVSGFDASLVAQYSVDPVVNFNELNTHWIFKPTDESTLSSLYAELIKQNGQYRIEYKPLIFDDIDRDIYAYFLGDVSGNYCFDYDNLQRNNNNLQFTDILIHHQSILNVSIIVPEPTYIEGLNLEIGYEYDFLNPLSFTINPASLSTDHYESLSNLSSNGTIKTVIWATDEPQLVSGLIGEVSFSWEDENSGGKIWLEDIFINDTYANGGLKLSGIDGEDTSDGLNIVNDLYPESISLQQNYPNPFNPQTNIYWSMPSSGETSIEIYNVQGQFVDILFDGYKETGNHEITWNASTYSSGIYFYRLTIGETILQKKMILLR